MVFFRPLLGKLDRGDKDAKADEDAAGNASAGGASGSAAPVAMPAASEPVRDKKKKPKDAEGSASAPGGGAEGRGASGVPARAQAGLSVNDFISKTKNQQRQGLKPSGPELIAYARYLGIDPVADHDLLWIAVEALEAPLPSDWTEHFDSNDRVFYYNATTRVSSWTHPLEHIYRETYKTIVNFRNANMHPEERGRKLHELQMEVKQMEADVHKEIAQWSEHTDEQNNRFYFNREERQSTWTDPRPAKCQILYLRIKMLGLLHGANAPGGGFDAGKGEAKFGDQGLSRFGALPGSEFDDPAQKRSKLGGASDEHGAAAGAGRRSPSPGSQHSDSDSDGDKKKKRKKKKKKKGDKDSDAVAPVRLGAPQKLGTSQSEPSVGGGKPLLGGKDHEQHGGGASASGTSRSPRNSAAGAAASGMIGQGAPGPQALLSPLDRDEGLTSHGRARVKAGIRLEPIGPGPAAPAGGNGSAGGSPAPDARGVKVGSSASVPAL